MTGAKGLAAAEANGGIIPGQQLELPPRPPPATPRTRSTNSKDKLAALKAKRGGMKGKWRRKVRVIMRLGGAAGLRSMEAQGEAGRLAAVEASELRAATKSRQAVGERPPPPGLPPVERLRWRQREKLRMRKRRAIVRIRAVIAFSGAKGLRFLVSDTPEARAAPKIGTLVRTASEDHVPSPRETEVLEKLNRRLSISTNNSAGSHGRDGAASPLAEPRTAAEVEAGLAARAAERKRAAQDVRGGRAAELYAELFDAIDQSGRGHLEHAEGCEFLRCSGCPEQSLAALWAEVASGAASGGDAVHVSRDRLMKYILEQEELDSAGGFVDEEQEGLLLRHLGRIETAATISPFAAAAAAGELVQKCNWGYNLMCCHP